MALNNTIYLVHGSVDQQFGLGLSDLGQTQLMQSGLTEVSAESCQTSWGLAGRGRPLQWVLVAGPRMDRDLEESCPLHLLAKASHGAV